MESLFYFIFSLWMKIFFLKIVSICVNRAFKKITLNKTKRKGRRKHSLGKRLLGEKNENSRACIYGAFALPRSTVNFLCSCLPRTVLVVTGSIIHRLASRRVASRRQATLRGKGATSQVFGTCYFS